MNNERVLATIRQIDDISLIENADFIERAEIGGWNVVVKKGEFKPGDKCVYFEVDSMLPDEPQYSFLADSSWKPTHQRYRLRTIKLRGVISQGLALPLSAFEGKDLPTELDADVTELLNVEKYEPYIPANLQGIRKGNFPWFIPKTDEKRFQNIVPMLSEIKEREWAVSEKLDGTSTTYYIRDGEFGFCSRNIEFKPETDNKYADIAKQYHLENHMIEEHIRNKKNFAIQGEIIGEGIQGNKYKIVGHKLFLFAAWDIDEQKYFDHNEFVKLASHLGIQTVPFILLNYVLPEGITKEEIIAMADGNSVFTIKTPGYGGYFYDTIHREGIVFKSMKEEYHPRYGRYSFKVISNNFLLKHNE